MRRVTVQEVLGERTTTINIIQSDLLSEFVLGLFNSEALHLDLERLANRFSVFREYQQLVKLFISFKSDPKRFDVCLIQCYIGLVVLFDCARDLVVNRGVAWTPCFKFLKFYRCRNKSADDPKVNFMLLY